MSAVSPTVLVVGAGGREHALAHTLARSADVVVAPGNPGMPGTSPEGHAITVSSSPPSEIDADLVVIGPAAPLVDGRADRLRAPGQCVGGPGAAGARLEGSKAFMKEVLAEAGVPTARYAAFDRVDEATDFLRSLPGPWVVKTDGLAAGKGVLVAESLAEAIADVEAKLSGAAFGAAGRRVVIEEGMAGPECSLMALCDGRHVVALAPAQDAKRLGEGDAGPNTGGMGAFSPIPALDAADVDSLMDTAVEPLLAALRIRGIDYRGVLYAGLMLTDEGPKVLEYNVRFGDPEAECVLVRLASDPFELLASVAGGSLQDAPRFTDDAAVCVVVASPGYPGATETGGLISGLDQRGQLEVPIEGVTVFHAGTARDAEGRFVTAGGRVLGITAVARGPEEARRRAYAGVAGIGWPGAQVRTDIGAAANTIGSAR